GGSGRLTVALQTPPSLASPPENQATMVMAPDAALSIEGVLPRARPVSRAELLVTWEAATRRLATGFAVGF
ncbi:MAG: hypothetical protein AB1609_15825, partial [Bacillota bacterium]